MRGAFRKRARPIRRLREFVIASLLASSAACLSSTEVEVPEVPGAKSLFLVFRTGDGRPEAIAFSLDDTGLLKHSAMIAAPARGERWAVLVQPSLPQLQLEEGRTPALGPDEGRPLFGEPRFFQLPSGKSRKSDWEVRTDPPRDIALRLPVFDAFACARAGGCIVMPPNINALCETPCPPRTPLTEPEPPRPPRMTDLSPCPGGWVTVTSTAPVAYVDCQPVIVRSPRRCGANEAQLLDQDRCSLIGGECGTGDWTVPPGGGDVLYVRPGETNGAGSMASPFGTIAEALAHARPGVTVALSKGRFEESVRLPGGISLAGACAADTVIEPSAPPGPVVAVSGGSARIANLTIRGGLTGVSVSALGAASIEEAIVERATIVAIEAAGPGAQVSLRRVLSRGCGQICLALTSATASVSASILDGGSNYGIFALSSTLSVSRSIVRNGNAGTGVALHEGSRASIERSMIELSQFGISVIGVAARPAARIDRLYILDRHERDRRLEYGLYIQNGAVDVTDSTVFGVSLMGVRALSSAAVRVNGLVIAEIDPEAQTGCDGHGFFATGASELDIARATITGNGCTGVFVIDPLTSMRLADTAIASTRSGPAGGLASGIACIGGRFTTERVSVLEPNRLGINAAECEPVVLTDTTVVRAGGGPGGEAFADAIQSDRSGMRLTRVKVDQARGAGLLFRNTRGVTRVEDVEISETGAEGLVFRQDFGARPNIGVARASIRKSATDGVAMRGDIVVHFSDLSVAGTVMNAGLRVGSFASATIERFRILQSPLAGVWVEAKGALDLLDGDIDGGRAGARIDCRPGAGCEETFNPQRLLVRVRYQNNARVIE